jgi:hypothetical protein
MAETWAAWLQDRLPPKMRHDTQQLAEAEQAEEARRAAEEADAAWAKRMHDQALANQMEYTTGLTAQERYQVALRGAAAVGERDVTAEWGSERRPAVRMGDVDLKPRELADGALTVRAGSVEAQLNRARQQPGREFMQRQVAELERRQRGGRPVISRSETPGTVACMDCIEQGATAEESFLLHQDPDDPLPERHAPQRSRRTRSGVGWPEIRR